MYIEPSGSMGTLGVYRGSIGDIDSEILRLIGEILLCREPDDRQWNPVVSWYYNEGQDNGPDGQFSVKIFDLILRQEPSLVQPEGCAPQSGEDLVHWMEELFELLVSRFEIAVEIALIEDEKHLPIRDPAARRVWLQQLRREGDQYNLRPTFVEKLFIAILDESFRMQVAHLVELAHETAED